jgi:single-strand DNA-binding protein
MASDNFTVQVGNLTDDPELRFTPNGTPVANFRLAVNQRVKDANGTWRDGEASFFKVNVWRDQAENVAESL